MQVLETNGVAVPAAYRRFRVTESVYRQIQETVGSFRAETGGMLGGSREDGVVREFYFDRRALKTGVSYSPDTEALNRLLREDWNPRGVNLMGFVHSHPYGMKSLSHGDRQYAADILKHIPELEILYLPIVFSEADAGVYKIHSHAVVRKDNSIKVVKLPLELVRDESPAGQSANGANSCAAPLQTDQVRPAADAEPASRVERTTDSFEARFTATPSLEATFRRVRGAYDLGRLTRSRLIVVGTGGAVQCVEELARAGVGEFVLIDHDVVSETNLATQQTYRRDLNRPKIDVLQERIADINPHAVVISRRQKLDDIDDDELRRLACDPLQRWSGTLQSYLGIPGVDVPIDVAIAPVATVLCGFTDSFEAQTRINRLSLQFTLPSLCAQVYHEGRGAEITFTHPATTTACHRCVLRSRYAAFLDGGFRNDVTSDGTPIFATSRLNALKGFIALALLHHGTDHPRWGRLLERIGNRNLIQIRMDPDLALGAFERVFANADRTRLLFDDVVWLPQDPDCPANGFPTCPDCGGTGNLLAARGTFKNTREMRR